MISHDLAATVTGASRRCGCQLMTWIAAVAGTCWARFNAAKSAGIASFSARLRAGSDAKVVARFQVPSRVVPRLAMGAVAFGLLMLAEVMLSVALFGRPMNDFVQGLTTLHGMIGLGGQVLFGLMPVVLDRTSTPKSCGR